MNLIKQDTRLVDNTTRQIALTQGKSMIVSAHRFDTLNRWKWHADVVRTKHREYWYARRSVVIDGIQINIKAHAFIMQSPEGFVVDHRDGNGLNNVDTNLRVCPQKFNSWNRRMNGNNTSGWPNINRRRAVWIVQIRCDGEIYKKQFSFLLDAIGWAEKVKQELFGEFYCKPNIPLPSEPEPYVHVRHTHKNNSSGYAGVTWDTSRKAWRVGRKWKGVKLDGGRHKQLESAIAKSEELRVTLGMP